MVTGYHVGLVAEALRRGLPVPDGLLRPVVEHVLAQMRIEQATGKAWRHPAEHGAAVGHRAVDHRSPGGDQAVRTAAVPPKPRSR